MKVALVLLAWLLPVSLLAQSNQSHLRLFGTNTVVDFTAAYQAGPGSAYSNYWLNARYLKRDRKVAIVERDEFVRVAYWVHLPGANAAVTVPVADSKEVVVLNYPNLDSEPKRVRHRKHVELMGLATGPLAIEGEPVRQGFDCGRVFTNRVTTNFNYYVAMPKGLHKAAAR